MTISNPEDRKSLREAINKDYPNPSNFTSLLDQIGINFDNYTAPEYENRIFSLIQNLNTEADKIKKLLELLVKSKPDNTAYHSILENMTNTVQPNSNHILPIVILAMTRTEATNLKFDPNYYLFKDTQKIIPSRDICLQEHYGEQREDWKPYGKDKDSIKTILENGISKINNFRDRQDKRRIEIVFKNADCFSEDDSSRYRIWQELKGNKNGFVLIIDPISLFNIQLKKYIEAAEIFTSNKTSMILFHGDIYSTLEINDWIKNLFTRHLNTAVINRFDDNDHLCELGIRDQRSLDRWLSSIVSIIFDYELSKTHNSRFSQLINGGTP
jgi:hypothetical protein